MYRKILPIVFTTVLFSLLITVNVLSNRLKSLKKPSESITINEEVLKRKLENPPPQWMLDQINSDLEGYRPNGISSQMLDEGFYSKDLECRQLVRFSIKDRSLTVACHETHRKSHHLEELVTAVNKLNELVVLPDIDFIISLQDGFIKDSSLPHTPWFVFAKSTDNDTHLLIPDLMALRGYPQIRETIEEGRRKISWEAKKELAFWRGATTGGSLTTTTWDHIARSKLVLLSLKYTQILDARFNRVVQAAPGVREILTSRGMVSKTVSRVDHLKYKYLIDVDGNTSTFERFFWLLLSNSLILKQQSSNLQWYYRALQPMVHFLPVKEDFSDLIEQIQWAKTHDREVKKMAEQATQFARNNLTNEDHFLYLTLLLREYAQLQH